MVESPPEGERSRTRHHRRRKPHERGRRRMLRPSVRSFNVELVDLERSVTSFTKVNLVMNRVVNRVVNRGEQGGGPGEPDPVVPSPIQPTTKSHYS